MGDLEMANAKAKTINLLLYEGSLTGVISIEDSSWNSGELYSALRESVSDLLNTDACNKYGVYLLLSESMVYVGQSSDLSKRITQHTVGKGWWESVLILTTKDDSLTHTDIDYLEAKLIKMANNVNRLDCDNKSKGNPIKVDKYRRVWLDQFLEEALFLMQLIGITVFTEKKVNKPIVNTVNDNDIKYITKRSKGEAINYLKEKGVNIGKNVTYATRNDKNEFLANPKIYLLEDDWWFVLNDASINQLIVLKIPSKTFCVKKDNKKGFYVRSDKPDMLDININAKTYIDNRSKICFKPFIEKIVEY